MKRSQSQRPKEGSWGSVPSVEDCGVDACYSRAFERANACDHRG